MAVLGGVMLTPAGVGALDVSESTFFRGRSIGTLNSGYCNPSSSSRSSLPVCVKAQGGLTGQEDDLGNHSSGNHKVGVSVTRRGALTGMSVSVATLAALALSVEHASAVPQTQLAGRIPGLSEPDSNGISFFPLPSCSVAFAELPYRSRY
jgi:hypothetical protein